MFIYAKRLLLGMRNLRDLLPLSWLQFELDEIVDPQRAVDRVWAAYRGQKTEVDPGEISIWTGVNLGVAITASKFLYTHGFIEEGSYGYFGLQAYIPVRSWPIPPNVPEDQKQNYLPGGTHAFELIVEYDC